MLEEKDLKKLEKLKEEVTKDKIESKPDVDTESLVTNIMAKEFNVLEERLFNGLKQIVNSIKKSIVTDINDYQDGKFKEIKRMLQDKGFEAEDPKQKEIMEYLDKLKLLVGESDGN